MRRTLATVAAMSLLLAAAPPADAYEPMTADQTGKELRWTALPMPFNIHDAPPAGISFSDTIAAIRAAYTTWEQVSCSYFSTEDHGVTQLPLGDDDDRINTHVFRSSWPADFAEEALGITLTMYDPYEGIILDADTHYNPNYSWAVDGDYWSTDLQSVATHEIGHQLGLDHPPEPAATMYYATGKGDTSQRSLHSDDIAGICHLYPSGSPPPPECTTSAHCAPNEQCVDQSCVLAAKKGYGGPCTAPNDCQSGLCLTSAGDSFCSASCDDTPCPNGDRCVPVSGADQIDKACLPNSASQGAKQLGDPCQVYSDCVTKICRTSPDGARRCTQACDAAAPCPAGFDCTSGFCVVPPGETPTPPGGDKTLGETCTAGDECLSGQCLAVGGAPICVDFCAASAAPAGCPAGFVCTPTSDPAKGVCLAEKKLPLGASCDAHDACASGLCVAASDGDVCAAICQEDAGCPAGFDCVAASGGRICLAEQGGCAVSDTTFVGPWPALLLLLAALGLRRRQR